MSRNDTMPVSVVLVRSTERAICVREYEDSENIWLPISQIECWDEQADEGEVITVIAPEWLLEDKGLL